MSNGEPALRIAFDMDGVLADMHSALAIEAERMFGEQGHPPCPRSRRRSNRNHRPRPPSPPLPGCPDVDRAAIRDAVAARGGNRRLLGRACGNGTGHRRTPGAAGRRAAVGGALRHPAAANPRLPGAEADAGTGSGGTASTFPASTPRAAAAARLLLALNLDVVVDDRFEGCVDVVDESSARPILVWRGPDERVLARARRLGITVVRSAGECLDLLEKVERRRASEPGLMSRLRHALRRK